MVKKYILFLFPLFLLSINAYAGKAQPGYSEIEAAERQYIIDELTYRLNTKKNCNPIQKWSDKGSGADVDGYFFIPTAEDNYFMIGGYATQSRKGKNCVITVSVPQENPEHTPTLLVAPVDWKLIWQDKGSGAEIDGSMWGAVPPDGNYRCLGSVPQAGYEKPNISGYRCVHASLTELISSSSVIWSDKGSGADKKVTMFRLPNTNSFVAVSGRSAKVETWDLRADAAARPDPKLVEEKLALRMAKIQQDLEGKMKADMEQKKLAEKAEQKKLAEAAEKKRLAEEAEQKKLAEAAEKKQLAEKAKQEQLAKQAEQKKPAEEEKQEQLAEVEEQKQLTEAVEPDQVVEESEKTEVAVTEKEITVTGVDDKQSSGASTFIFFVLKIFLIVLGLFTFLGFVIYKLMKEPEKKAGV